MTRKLWSVRSRRSNPRKKLRSSPFALVKARDHLLDMFSGQNRAGAQIAIDEILELRMCLGVLSIFQPRLRKLIRLARDQVRALKRNHFADGGKGESIYLGVSLGLGQIELGPIEKLVADSAIKEKMNFFAWLAGSDRVDDAVDTFNETILFRLSELVFERANDQFIPCFSVNGRRQRHKPHIKNDGFEAGVDLIAVGAPVIPKIFIAATIVLSPPCNSL